MRVWTAKDGSDLPPFVLEAVEKKVTECYEKANAFFSRKFPRCAIQYGVNGGHAGYANYTQNLIKLNSELLLRNYQDMLEDTVPHEVAHLITRQVFGNSVKSHGNEWRTVMMAVFGIQPSRCHKYPLQYVLNKSGTGYRKVPVNPHTRKRGF